MSKSSTVIAALLLGLTLSVPAMATQTHTIAQRNGQFIPDRLTVKKGDKVVFVNDDSKPHHVVSHTPGFPFDLDLQQPGVQNEVVMDQVGEVVVSCDIHPRMEVVITVTD